MTFELLKKYCLSKKAAHEDYPFGENTLVIKIANKIFAILFINNFSPAISLKCDPILAELLRNKYIDILPGYHLNKRLWNTVTINGNIPDEEITFMIDHSYEQVYNKLTKKQKEQILNL